MNIGIIGYGYIGAVCSAALLLKEHHVFIYDRNKSQTFGVSHGKYKFPENDVQQLINNNSLDVTVVQQINDLYDCDILVVCVNTSLQSSGRLDYSNITDVIESLNITGFKGKLILRSTLPLDGKLINFLEKTYTFEVYVLPEFLREGTALSDLISSDNIVIGFQNGTQPDQEVINLFAFEDTNLHAMPIKDAIFTKLLNNTWHALKVAFSNEWNSIATDNGISNYENIYKAFVADKHLNISEKYLRPGGPYGGPCLPKDISEFCGLALSEPAHISQAVIESNDSLIEQLSQRISDCLSDTGETQFDFDTYEFKKGTNDVRFSPLVKIVDILQKRGFSKNENANIKFCGRSLLDKGIITFSEISERS